MMSNLVHMHNCPEILRLPSIELCDSPFGLATKGRFQLVRFHQG